MIFTTEYVDVPADVAPMCMLVAAPKADGRYPAILFYSDIFQLTGPMVRATARLAGYGFVVGAPEIYHRIEPAGTVIPFDDDGRTRGLADAMRTPVADFDADARTALDWLARHPKAAPNALGVAGFCIGGHLAFRGALQPDVRATACFYGTGIHDGKLGRDADAGSLEQAGDVRGQLLMVWGSGDPHIPEAGRERIRTALAAAGVAFRFSEYPAEHAFMRDEGPRYDPEATDGAWAEMIAFFRGVF